MLKQQHKVNDMKKLLIVLVIVAIVNFLNYQNHEPVTKEQWEELSKQP